MRIFVYGTLKRGNGNHRLLNTASTTFIGPAVTLKPFAMIGHGVPFVWPDETGKPVIGEVYDIGELTAADTRHTLERLDNLESNGHVYERKPHIVRILETGEECQAWIYEAMAHVQRGRPYTREDHLSGDGLCHEWHRFAPRFASDLMEG